MKERVEFRNRGESAPWATLEAIGDNPILAAAMREVFPQIPGFPAEQSADEVAPYAAELVSTLSDEKRKPDWLEIDTSDHGLGNALGWAVSFSDLCRAGGASILTLVPAAAGPATAQPPGQAEPVEA